MWKMTAVDMSEIARNSVLQSGFDHEQKVQWLGPNYELAGIEGNGLCSHVFYVT